MNKKRARTLRRHPELAREASRGAPGPKPLRQRPQRGPLVLQPSWPRSADQWAQSRPVIVMHPVRQQLQYTGIVGYKSDRAIRAAGNHQPKHWLDTRALNVA